MHKYISIDFKQADEAYTCEIGVTSLAPIEKAAQDNEITNLEGIALINKLIILAHQKKVLGSTRLYKNGLLHDAGTMAAYSFYIKGQRDSTERYQNGKKNDGVDNSPALTEFRHAGRISRTMRYKDDRENDGPNGEPAEIIYDAAGLITATNHYTNGVFVKAGEIPVVTEVKKPHPRDTIQHGFGKKIRFA